MNLLFVCSRNKWRSRTAETIFKDLAGHTVRSAGTENEAVVRISEKLIDWADLVFVMEKHHRTRLIEKFGDKTRQKEIIILEIEDDYQFMDPELIEMLQTSVEPYLN